jgi:hypothetical protein
MYLNTRRSLGNLRILMHVCAGTLSFKTMKSRNLVTLKFLYRGTTTAVLLLTVALIIDHSHFVFIQCIILRTKKSKCRENFSQSSPLKCSLNNNATISKIIITYGRYSYNLNYSHDYVT